MIMSKSLYQVGELPEAEFFADRDNYSDSDIIKCEIEMLKSLDFDILATTPYDHILGYSQCFDNQNGNRILKLSANILAQSSLNDIYLEKINSGYTYNKKLPYICIAIAYSMITCEQVISSSTKNTYFAEKIDTKMINKIMGTIYNNVESGPEIIGIDLKLDDWNKYVDVYNNCNKKLDYD